MKYLSASKLKSIRECPRRTFEEPYTPSAAMEFGTVAHLVAAAVAQGKVKTHEEGGELFASELAKVKFGTDDALLTPSHIDRARVIVDNLLSDDRININPDNVLTVESADGEYKFRDGSKTMFQVDVVPGKWGLRGGMDLVDLRDDGTLRILDWKSGMSVEDDDLQLAIYALAAWKKYPGFPKIETAFYYLEKGYYDRHYWDEQSLIAALNYVDGLALDYIDAEKSKTRQERLNKRCGYCSLKGDCKTYLNRTAVIPVTSAWSIEPTLENFGGIVNNLEQIAAIRKAAEGIESELIRARNALLRDHQTITDNGRVYTFSERVTRYEYDTPAVFNEVAAKIGRAPLEIVSISSGDLDDLVKASFPGRGNEERKTLEQFIRANRKPKGYAVVVKTTLAKEIAEDATTDEEVKPNAD